MNLEKNKFWKEYKEHDLTIWIKGNIYSHSIKSIIDICKNIKKDEVQSFISGIYGHFALVVKKEDLTFIAVDKIRSTPLFFVNIKNDFFINCDPKRLVELKKIFGDFAIKKASFNAFLYPFLISLVEWIVVIFL